MQDDALACLRGALMLIRPAQAPGTTLASLATELGEVSRQLPDGMGLTIDFGAAATLGHPLVVVRPSRDLDPCFSDLTPRERQVAGLVATGLRNRDIALALDISVATVKDHVHRILAKSQLDSRAAVAARWGGGGAA